MQPKDNDSVIFLAFANELGDQDSFRYLRIYTTKIWTAKMIAAAHLAFRSLHK